MTNGEECWHRDCDLKATKHIRLPAYHIKVCSVHYKVLERAANREGGYSSANTSDNVFGWRRL